MIGKIRRNNSFRETTHYVLHKEKARLLGGTIAGQDIATISREFRMSRNINPNIEQPVYHLIQSYSYHDRDTQSLTDDKLLELSIRHFAGMVVSAQHPHLLKEEGLASYKNQVEHFMQQELFNYQFFVARHEDVAHPHTHLVASRIHLQHGRAIPTYLEQKRSQSVCRQLEQDFGLQQLSNSREGRRNPSRKQADRTRAGDPIDIHTQLQDTIDHIAQAQLGITVDQFIDDLKQAGVEVRLRGQGNQTGISYSLKGVAIRGSKLGQNYTYAGLQKHYGIRVDPSSNPTHQTPNPSISSDADAVDSSTTSQPSYLQQILPIIQTLWKRAKTNKPTLSHLKLGDYQIQADEDSHPVLWKGGIKLVARSEETYKDYGLTQKDCETIERIHRLSLQRKTKKRKAIQSQAKEQPTQGHHEGQSHTENLEQPLRSHAIQTEQTRELDQETLPQPTQKKIKKQSKPAHPQIPPAPKELAQEGANNAINPVDLDPQLRSLVLPLLRDLLIQNNAKPIQGKQFTILFNKKLKAIQLERQDGSTALTASVERLESTLSPQEIQYLIQSTTQYQAQNQSMQPQPDGQTER